MFLTVNYQKELLVINSRQKTQAEVQAQERLPNQAGISETIITQGGGILAFLFFWGGFLILASKRLKRVSDEQLDSCTNPSPNHHCAQCKYFAKNHFMNCAVQPSLVLTDEAKNCSDYSPKTKNP